MLEKLADIEQHYIEIEQRLAQPDIFSDPEAAAKLMKEQKDLTPVVECFRAYKAAEQTAADSREMMESEEDAELRAMAEEEYYAARDEMAAREDELRVLLLPRDPNDERSVIMEIPSSALSVI